MAESETGSLLQNAPSKTSKNPRSHRTTIVCVGPEPEKDPIVFLVGGGLVHQLFQGRLFFFKGRLDLQGHIGILYNIYI